ncbi:MULTISPECIES: hypothetical protein [Rheinheimera]|uniref:DUF904 domain-containing protein n=1 Tax=Rheinheimera tilapiae TaxID=875043 RepID=A0ABV6BA96_9GAMM
MTHIDNHVAGRIFKTIEETRASLLEQLVHNMDPIDTALLRGRIQMLDELLSEYKAQKAKTESGTQ